MKEEEKPIEGEEKEREFSQGFNKGTGNEVVEGNGDGGDDDKGKDPLPGHGTTGPEK